MRISRFQVVVALSVALSACGSDLAGPGERCFGSSECDPGLTCDFGQDPPVCSQGQTLIDAALIDADLSDAPLIDGASVDAPMIDAPVIDAAPIDAMIDAATDAMIDADIDA